jgi:Xaa-Pro aminopeptidase/Xaa-Pro dipeptidase
MAITIEPGIYLKGKFGVRIEDSIIVNSTNNNRVMNLTSFIKDLIILGQNLHILVNTIS